MRINEELLATIGRGFGLENRDKRPKAFAALTTRHVSIRKSWHYFAGSGGRSIGIVPLLTKSHGSLDQED
jgi:hypothetical protein